jgi:hypothetical protein
VKALSFAIAIGAALALAGCAAGPTTPTGTPTASDTPSATPTPEFDIGPEGGCDPHQLEISVHSRPQDSGAGQFYWELQFSNASAVDCNLEGNPTIVQLDAAGGQVGAPAGVEYVDGSGTVPLPSGATAYSIIHFSQAGNYECPMVDVASIRVTIPHRDDSTAVTLPVPDAIQGCDSDQVTFNSGSITATEQPG